MKTDLTVLTALIGFIIAFLWPISARLSKMHDFETFTPADADAIVQGLIFGCGAIAIALGIDIKAMIGRALGLFKGDQ